MDDIQKDLFDLPAGKLTGASAGVAIRHLGACWGRLSGSSEESTTADKLHRAESLTWDPPVLTFTLERHGGTVNGSTRGELHHWKVDLAQGTAQIVRRNHRQLSPTAKKLDVKALAREVAAMIVAGAKSEKLDWKTEGTVVLNMAAIIPVGVKSTTDARRKKFHRALVDELRQEGWGEERKGTRISYARDPSA